MSSKELEAHFQKKISTRIICLIFKVLKTLKYMKVNIKPILTQRHKITRKEAIFNYIKIAIQRNNVIFSVEKRFGLVGPYGT